VHSVAVGHRHSLPLAGAATRMFSSYTTSRTGSSSFGPGWASMSARVMYNDFVLIGPHDDPARVRGDQ